MIRAGFLALGLALFPVIASAQVCVQSATVCCDTQTIGGTQVQVPVSNPVGSTCTLTLGVQECARSAQPLPSCVGGTCTPNTITTYCAAINAQWNALPANSAAAAAGATALAAQQAADQAAINAAATTLNIPPPVSTVVTPP
jgi:hypothetical protein